MLLPLLPFSSSLLLIPPLFLSHLLTSILPALLTVYLPSRHYFFLDQSLQDEVQQSVRSIKASPKKSSSPKSPTQPRKNVRDRNSSSSSGVKNSVNTKKTEEKRSVRDIMMVRYSDDDEEEDRKSSFRGSARGSTKSDTTSDARSGVKRFVNRDDRIAVDRDIYLKSIRHENHVDLCRSSDDSDEPIADMIAKRKKYAEKKDNDSWESYSPERRNEV